MVAEGASIGRQIRKVLSKITKLALSSLSSLKCSTSSLHSTVPQISVCLHAVRWSCAGLEDGVCTLHPPAVFQFDKGDALMRFTLDVAHLGVEIKPRFSPCLKQDLVM